jgi:hypothetical protein
MTATDGDHLRQRNRHLDRGRHVERYRRTGILP